MMGTREASARRMRRGEEEVKDRDFLFLLLGDSLLQADRSLTFKDLLVLALDAL